MEYNFQEQIVNVLVIHFVIMSHRYTAAKNSLTLSNTISVLFISFHHSPYPPASEASREVTHFIERKNKHTKIYSVKLAAYFG